MTVRLTGKWTAQGIDWEYDNGWSIVRFPKDRHRGGFPHTYRVCILDSGLQAADNLLTLAEARRILNHQRKIGT